MKKGTILLILSVFFIFGCSIEDELTNDSSQKNLYEEQLRGAVIHHVSAGSNDACEAYGLPPGCDANFSLVANMHADGSVSGQWHDTWSGGGNGIHVEIDCMIIIDNMAILGGVVTNGNWDGDDYSGGYALTFVVDNGTSHNDTPDQLSWTFIETIFENCDDISSFDFELYPPPLFDITKGQVKVW